MPDNTMVVDNDGAPSRAPEAIEQPVAEDPQLLNEMVKREPSVSGVHWRLRLIDSEYAPHAPTSDIEASSDAKALSSFRERANKLCNDADKAAAAARAEWADPSTLGQRLERVQSKAVNDAVGLFRDCRAAAAAFVARRTANTAPSPDDVVVLDMGRAILAHASPSDAVQWFTDAFYRGGRSWAVLRLLAARAGDHPPQHLAGTPFQSSLAQLAAMPYADPASDARAAREFAADVVNDVRRRLTNWSLAAGGYEM